MMSASILSAWISVMRIVALQCCWRALYRRSAAMAVFVFRMGDTVYVDGKRYSWEEWKKIRDTYQQQPAQTAAVSVPSQAPRAASCITTIYYDEFSVEDERFQCTPAGALTREEILRQGWKIDLIEKIPPRPASRRSRRAAFRFTSTKLVDLQAILQTQHVRLPLDLRGGLVRRRIQPPGSSQQNAIESGAHDYRRSPACTGKAEGRAATAPAGRAWWEFLDQVDFPPLPQDFFPRQRAQPELH